MKKERNRMKKAQSRKREPFRIYRASITVEAAVLAVIYSDFSADVFVTEDDHVLSADRSGSTGNHICGRTRYIKDVLEDSFSTTGNGRNKRESGIAGG
mgnify:CR=1 FL=1